MLFFQRTFQRPALFNGLLSFDPQQLEGAHSRAIDDIQDPLRHGPNAMA